MKVRTRAQCPTFRGGTIRPGQGVRLAMVLVLALCGPRGLGAQENPDFARDVAPILNQYCVGCHAEGDAEAGLRLDSFSHLTQGGENGPTINRDQLGKSLLLERLTGSQDAAMPPEDEPQPSDAERQLLIRWIQAGAPGPKRPEDPRILRTPKLPASNAPKPVTAVAYTGGDGDNHIVVLGDNIRTAGIEVTSKRGLLAPLPIVNGTPDAAPFDFALSNTKHKITLGRLGKTVDFDGELRLGIAYLGKAPKGDLEVTYGDGATVRPIAFRVGLDGRMAVGRFGEVEILKPATRERISRFATNGKVNSLQFSRDGKHLVVATGIAGLRGEAVLWNVAGARQQKIFAGHSDTLYDAKLTPDGKLLATASYDRKILLWDVESGEIIRTFSGHNGAVYDLDFSPDGKILVSASADATVKVWDVQTGKRLDTLGQPLKEQYSVAISPDGKRIIAGGEDNRIRMWDLVSVDGPRINPMVYARFAHEGAIHHVEYRGDGAVIVSASSDQNVKIWSTDELQQLDSFQMQSDSTQAVGLPNRRNIVSVGRRNGTVEAYSFILPDRTQRSSRTQVDVRPHQQVQPVSEWNEQEPNDDAGTANTVVLPVTISGTISKREERDHFVFKARAGEPWILEVKAARDQSALDSHVSVLYRDGSPVPRVKLQAVRDSYFTFRGKDSNTTGDFRVHNWEEMKLNQFLYAEGEVVKLYHYPRGPDSGFNVYPNYGSRRGFFDTTPLAHALHAPCYVVEPHPATAELPASGLPVFTLHFENDDDSQRRMGRDSYLTFVPPKDGEYVAAIRDVRGLGGDDFKYQLRIRPPQPSFQAKLINKDLSVAPGTGKKFGIEVQRIDGFQGPVDVEISNVPAGFSVPGPLQVEANHDRVWATLIADENARAPSEEDAAKLTVRAVADIDGQKVERTMGSLGKISLADPPKLLVQLAPDNEPSAGGADLPVIEIRPGSTSTATIRITREGHDGRVGFGNESGAINAPHGVYVDNIGLNGVLIVEGQQERQFFITAEPWVQPMERVIFVEAGEAGKPTSNPVILRVLPAGRPQTERRAETTRQRR